MAGNKQSSGKIFLGGLLIVVGGLFLLRNFELIDPNISKTLFSYPSILIFIGILSFLNSSKKMVGTLLIAVGGALHISRYYEINFGGFILPLILIGFGFMILLKHNRYSSTHFKNEVSSAEEVREDKLEDISIFGGSSKIFSTDNFRGGTITSIFGGSEINLSGCKLAEGENIIDVIAIFGGTTIIVPKEWNVIVDVFPLFGGFGIKGKRDPMLVVEKDRVLRIKGVVIFGGGEIKLT